MKSLDWKEKFNIPKDSDHSLAEILRSGFISEEDYLLWASETYQIPIVDSDFFKITTDYKLLTKYPSPAWNESFFPMADWEGTLFILCLEPQEISIEHPYQFVLGPLFRMETLWSRMEKESSTTSLPPDDIDLEPSVIFTPGIPLSSVPHKEEIPSFSLEKIATVAQEVTALEEVDSPEDAEKPETPPAPEPASYFDNTPDTPSAYAAFKNPAAATSDNVYEDSKITSLFSQTESTQIAIPDFVIDELMREEITPPPASADPKTEVTINPHVKAEDYEPEITNVVKTGQQQKEVTFTNTKTILPFPERSTHFSFIRTVFSDQVILEARSKIKDCTDPHHALISAFHILKDYYKKLMWAVRDQKGAVYPIASNTAWDFSEEAWNTPIDFKSPNPFRIAKFTAKPYHGEVYPNPINDRFFSLWNNGKYPNVFTIVPVRLQGKVFAYFIGCEPAMHYHPTNSLDIMQSSCNELIQTFVTLHKELNPKAKAS